jgi:hypothetical protein
MARLPAAACLAAGVLLQLLVAALAVSTLPAQPWNDGPSKAVPLLEDRIAAAASAAAETCHVHVGLFFGTTMNGLISDQRRGNAARVPYKLVISKLAPGKCMHACHAAALPCGPAALDLVPLSAAVAML